MKISNLEFDQLRRWIEKECGISLGDGKKYLIETRLARLVAETGAKSYGEFYGKLSRSTDPRLRDKIVDAMTTNETLWFRDGAPWKAIRDHLFPELSKGVRPGARVRIWSAACSTGQEPYTVSMLVHEFCRTAAGRGLKPEQFEILATDISSSALMLAKLGRYDRISMSRGLTGEWAALKARYFDTQGPLSTVKSEVKRLVRFERFNLQASMASKGNFDLVMLRNVAIYFSDDFKRQLFERIANILNPRGVLLLGSAETLRGHSNRFVPEDHGRAVFYRKKAGGAQKRSVGATSQQGSRPVKRAPDAGDSRFSFASTKVKTPGWPKGGSK